MAWSRQCFCELKRYDEAFAAYDKALALKPDLAEALAWSRQCLQRLKRYDEAFAAYDKALALKPDLVGAEGYRLHAKMHLCDWNNFDAECAHLISSVRNGNANTQPFDFSLSLHLLKTNCDALSCGSRIKILRLKSRFGKASDTITTEFVLLMFPLTFVNMQSLILWRGCLSATTNLVLKLRQYQLDLMIIQKCVSV